MISTLYKHDRLTHCHECPPYGTHFLTMYLKRWLRYYWHNVYLDTIVTSHSNGTMQILMMSKQYSFHACCSVGNGASPHCYGNPGKHPRSKFGILCVPHFIVHINSMYVKEQISSVCDEDCSNVLNQHGMNL